MHLQSPATSPGTSPSARAARLGRVAREKPLATKPGAPGPTQLQRRPDPALGDRGATRPPKGLARAWPVPGVIRTLHRPGPGSSRIPGDLRVDCSRKIASLPLRAQTTSPRNPLRPRTPHSDAGEIIQSSGRAFPSPKNPRCNLPRATPLNSEPSNAPHACRLTDLHNACILMISRDIPMVCQRDDRDPSILNTKYNHYVAMTPGPECPATAPPSIPTRSTEASALLGIQH